MKTILGTVEKDRWYIILSFLSGFALLGIYLILVNVLELDFFPAVFILVLVYSVLFDINHYFSTYYRVFLDKSYYRENKNWIFWGLGFVTIVPMSLYFILGWQSESMYHTNYYFFLFFRRFVLVLGLYHLIKQNWGFMAMYKRSAKEPKTKYNWDLYTLISGSFIPLILLNIKSPIWFPIEQRSGNMSMYSEEVLFQPFLYFAEGSSQANFIIDFWNTVGAWCIGFAVVFGLIVLLGKRFEYTLPAKNMAKYSLFVGVLIFAILAYGGELVLSIVAGAAILFFLFSLYKSIQFQRKQPVFNKRKWAVLITSLILYFGIILFPIEGNKVIIVAAITLPHNIQYLAFVPNFSRKQYEKDGKDHGIAHKLSKKLILLFLMGVGFGLVFEFGRYGLGFGMVLPQGWFQLQNAIAVFFIAMILHHYYLDALIWKFSKNKDLKKGER